MKNTVAMIVCGHSNDRLSGFPSTAEWKKSPNCEKRQLNLVQESAAGWKGKMADAHSGALLLIPRIRNSVLCSKRRVLVLALLTFAFASMSSYTTFIYPIYVRVKHGQTPTPYAMRPYLPPAEIGGAVNGTTCRDFFTVLPDGHLKKQGEQYKSVKCEKIFGRYQENLEILNERMARMGTKLYVYSDMEDVESRCNLSQYTHIESVYFEPSELFQKHGLGGKVYSIVQEKWTNKYARLSDVFRVLLAKEHRHSYIDLDVVLISRRAEVFMQPYVGVSVTMDARNALEITNAAFCLPQEVLHRMTLFIKNRVLDGPSTYFYTEMGPSLFHKVIFNSNASVSLYSLNDPQSPDLDRLVRETIAYNHLLWHLNGHVRKGNPFLSYSGLVEKIEAETQYRRKKYKGLRTNKIS
jgi:hypothetical protein